jgi:putative Mg2+ transporter-C (MgtC) family protein
MLDFLNDPQIKIVFQLSLAALLGGLIGVERETQKKEAGLRTYILVSIGAALFTSISFHVFRLFINEAGITFDPARIIGQIVLGVGFLGAGMIIFRGSHIEGLTTAAGLWLVAAIGSAVAVQLYLPAIFTTFLALLVLSGLKIVEQKIFHKEE